MLLILLGPKDPQQALKLMVNWDLPLQTVSSKILAPWLRAHPREAMRLLLARKSSTLHAGDAGSGTLREIARSMAELDPAGTLSMPPAANRYLERSIFDEVMKAWASRDLPAAAAWLAGEGVDQKKRNGWSRSLLQVWSKTDPLEAIAWADSHVTGHTRMQANSILIPALAAHDAAGALDFVHRMTPGFSRDEAVWQVTGALLSDKGKDEALANFQRITALPDAALRTDALQSAARHMMRVAPEEFLAWLGSPEGADAPFRALTSTAEALAEKDGETAMKWATGLRGDITGGVRQSVLYKWMEKDPETARDWVESLPEGAERVTSVTNATAFLPRRISPEKYTTWLDSLPASDHPAVREGLAKAEELDPGVKAALAAKYR
ncbi:MAG: hypothetical protein V4726_13775 [Verrucomicrobiota bacterium]